MNEPLQTAVILAPGFEEIEAITVIDVLRRAEIPVLVASLSGALSVRGAHDIIIEADCPLSQIDAAKLNLVVLPGGLPGARHLAESQAVLNILQTVYESGHLVAAICAAPLALKAATLLEGRKMTCYPAFREQFEASEYLEEAVVQDGRIITGSGPGTALQFSLRLVGALGLKDIAEKLRRAMLSA